MFVFVWLYQFVYMCVLRINVCICVVVSICIYVCICINVCICVVVSNYIYYIVYNRAIRPCDAKRSCVCARVLNFMQPRQSLSGESRHGIVKNPNREFEPTREHFPSRRQRHNLPLRDVLTLRGIYPEEGLSL